MKRAPGYVLTPDEVTKFWTEEETGGRYFFQVAQHFRKGVFVYPTNRFDNASVMVLDDGDVYEQIPDFTRDDEFGRMTFHGSHLSESERVDVAARMMVTLKIEAAFAMKFWCKPEMFTEDASRVEEYRHELWFGGDGLTPHRTSAIHRRLMELSQPYRVIIEFLGDPRARHHRGLLEDVINGRGCGLAYRFAE